MHRKILIAATAFACASALAACGRSNETGGAPDQNNQAANTAQDVAGATTGVGTAAVGAVSKDAFIRDAAMGDMYELDAARMALMRSKSADVKKFAQMMIDDHTKSSTKLKMLISSGQVQGTLPAALDERRKGMLDNLRGASDQDFDDRYLDQQTMAHHEMLLLMNGYMTAGQDEALKAFAAEVAPVVQMHVDMVTNLDRHTRADDTAGANTTAR